MPLVHCSSRSHYQATSEKSISQQWCDSRLDILSKYCK